MKRFASLSVVLALVVAAPAAAFASLITDTPFFQDFGGTGFGAVNTVLTVQRNPASGPGAESGCSGPCATGIAGGDEKPGTPHMGNPTLGEIGVTSASDIRIVFNADEPMSGLDPLISLDNLVLTILDPTATSILGEYSSAAGSIVTDTEPESGIGNSGYVWKLDAAQATALDACCFDLGNRVGLGANLSEAGDGPETFWVMSFETGPIPPSPPVSAAEPSSVAMMGLLGIGALVVRRIRRR